MASEDLRTASSQPNVDDDETWAEAEGLPKFTDPVIQQYLSGRDALIEKEKEQRSDHVFRQIMSPMAREASAIVSAIRFEEKQTVWTREFEDALAERVGDIWPGMMFTLAKERMEQTKLWKIIRKMPKGALLHCHIDAMLEVDWLIEQAFTEDGICIVSPQPLATEGKRASTPFSFAYSKKATEADANTLWTAEYKTNTPIPIHKAAESFPNQGKEGFIKWLRSRLMITEEESLRHHDGPNDIWRKFQSIFPILGGLIYYEPIYRRFLRNMFKQLLEDGVQWVDMRTAFAFKYRRAQSETVDDGYEEMLSVMEEEIKTFRESEEGKDFWGARMIWTTIRRFDKRKIVESMQECIDMKILYPDLICGFDVVGQEDAGRPLADMIPELLWFKKACVEEGVEIPFFFHAGETLEDGGPTDENLFDAVLLGTRRIGHGFSLYKHPLLIERIKEKKILIESCPVSNEILRLTGSIMTHPLPALLARGVPVSLCNDDPGILGQGTFGMTHDFWQALQGWDNLGLEGLASLAESSVRWACYEDQTSKEWQRDITNGAYGSGIRAQRLQEWSERWEKFCQWVVKEYSLDVDLDPEE